MGHPIIIIIFQMSNIIIFPAILLLFPVSMSQIPGIFPAFPQFPSVFNGLGVFLKARLEALKAVQQLRCGSCEPLLRSQFKTDGRSDFQSAYVRL